MTGRQRDELLALTQQEWIAGDNKAHFGATAYALDQVRKAGIEEVSIETRVRDTGK